MKRSLLIALVALVASMFVSVPAFAGNCPQSRCRACEAAAREGENTDRTCPNGVDCVHGTIHASNSLMDYSAAGWRLSILYSLGKYSCGWSVDDQIVVYCPDGVVLVFRRGSPWRNYGDAGTPVQSAYALSGDNTAQNMTLTRSSQHGKVVYEFYGFTGSALDGKLISRTVGDPASSTQTVSYGYNGSGQLTSTTDEFGRTTTYQYTSGASPVLSKVIESHPADPTNPLNNTHGKVAYYVYEGGNLVREEIGVPKTVAADPGDDGDTAPTSTDYYWRRTAYVYSDEGQLTHVIPPEQYDAWADSTEPDRNEKHATQVYEYYPTGHAYAGKVKAQSGSGCGGGLVLGTEYTYPDPSGTKLYLGATPPDNENAPTYQMNVYRWEYGKRRLIKVLQMNNNEQPLFELTRATDTTGLLKATQYNTNYQADNIIHYGAQFDWEDPDNATYTADDLLTGSRFTHDASLRRTALATWDGTDCVTITEWGYVGDTRFVDNETAHVDGATTLVTHYLYDADNRLVCTVQPQVLSTQNSYDGTSYDVSYYLGNRTFYDAYGRVTETRSVKLSSTPADWPTVSTDLDNLASTKYYYADDDGLDSDGDGTTDEVDGSEGFELTRTVVDEGGLDLETRYQYAVLGGQWVKTAEIVDPTNPDNATEKHLNLVTSYDYTTINPEDGAWGNPTTITEPETAYVTTIDYDPADRVITRTRTCGGEVMSSSRYRYCKYGKTCSSTEAVGFPEERSTVTEWDDVGRTKRVYSNVANLVWANGSWSGAVRGDVTEYDYITGTDRTEKVRQKAGWAACAPTVIGSYTYTADGKQSIVTDAVGNQTTYAYEKGTGNLDNVTNALGEVTAYTHDRQGRLTFTEQYDDGSTLIAKSESKYDSLGRVYESVVYNPDHQAYTIVTETWHDPLGRVKKYEDAGNNAVIYTYDKAGRQIQVSYPAAVGDDYTTYDPAGRVVISQHNRDSADADNELTINYYDANGSLTATALWGTNAPTGWSWSTVPVPWDASFIPASAGVSDDNHLVTTYSYGCDSTYGAYVTSTDPMGIQRFAYVDRIGRSTRAVESKDGIDRVTLYGYDLPVSGKGYTRDTITARNGSFADQVTQYVRADSADAGRVTTTVYPDGGQVVVAYNADGSVKSRTDQRQWKTSFTYDALGRATEEDVETLGATPLVGTTKVTRTYDALGRPTALTDNNGNDADNYTLVTWAYAWDNDSTDQTVTESQYREDTLIGSVVSVLNGEGERTSLTYPNGRALDFTYDATHRLATIAQSGTTLASYQFIDRYLAQRRINNGALWMTICPGVDSGQLDGYDAFGRIKEINHHNEDPGGDQAAYLKYGYDKASNPTYQEDARNDHADELYSYDSLHRLVAFARGDLNAQKTAITGEVKAQDWALDKLGNWTDFDDNGTADVRQHNEVNEIALPAGGQGQVRTIDGTPREITHDAAGNIATLEENDGSKTWRYTYDYRNRLVKAESRTTGSYTTVVTYFYDGLNRRVKKDLETGADVLYIYDGWQVVEEHDNAGGGWQVNRQFVYGGQYIDEPLLFDRNDDPETDNDCTEAGDTRYLYCQNANYNVMALTIDNATAVETYQYDPYGECTVVTDDSSGNPYRFQGRRLDPETGLYYFRNRYYWPTLGRFGQRDPSEDRAEGHFYLSFNGSPYGWSDSLGLAPEDGGGFDTCCCCVESVEFIRVQRLGPREIIPRLPVLPDITVNIMGHRFFAQVKMTYVKVTGEVKTDCTLSWWEKSTERIPVPGRGGQGVRYLPAGEWHDLVEESPDDPRMPAHTFRNRVRQPRPGSPPPWEQEDKPRIRWRIDDANYTKTRVHDFNIIVRSSSDEVCKGVCQHASLNQKWQQKLVVRKGVRMWDESYFRPNFNEGIPVRPGPWPAYAVP